MSRERIRIQSRKFAWGCNAWGDSLCPSLAAFPQTSGKELKLYGNPGLYDDMVRSFLGTSKDDGDERAFNDEQGEIDESLAREKWLSALFEMEHKPGPGRDEATIKEHRLVAQRLGWIGALTRKPS